MGVSEKLSTQKEKDVRDGNLRIVIAAVRAEFKCICTGDEPFAKLDSIILGLVCKPDRSQTL
jgi:hypothetical protein